MSKARNPVATWDETFMAMAEVVKERSKDPSTQVGAVIVTPDNRVLSLGYNGAPNGYPDETFPWGKESEDELETKYPFVIHAERNAVLNFRGTLREFQNAVVYVTHFPCNECAKELIQVGIKKVIYKNEVTTSSPLNLASVKMFEALGIEYVKYSDLS